MADEDVFMVAVGYQYQQEYTGIEKPEYPLDKPLSAYKPTKRLSHLALSFGCWLIKLGWRAEQARGAMTANTLQWGTFEVKNVGNR